MSSINNLNLPSYQSLWDSILQRSQAKRTAAFPNVFQQTGSTAGVHYDD